MGRFVVELNVRFATFQASPTPKKGEGSNRCGLAGMAERQC